MPGPIVEAARLKCARHTRNRQQPIQGVRQLKRIDGIGGQDLSFWRQVLHLIGVEVMGVDSVHELCPIEWRI